MAVGFRPYYTRMEAGLQETDVAARFDEPQSFVSNYESGDVGSSLLELRQVCMAVAIRLTELVRRFDERVLA